jgi:hypothetical protein
MPRYLTDNIYERHYRAVRVLAYRWSPEILTKMVRYKLSQPTITDAEWGSIDAMTDLLGGIDPPGYHISPVPPPDDY